jgi:hypothetical protein
MNDLFGGVGCILVCSTPFVLAAGAVASSHELKDNLAKSGAMMAAGGVTCTVIAHSIAMKQEEKEEENK